MAHKDVRCQDCRRELGEPFEHVHDWLDAHAFVNGKFDVRHHRHRHHAEGVAEVERKWGEMAARAAIIHIRRDMGKVYANEAAMKFDVKPGELIEVRDVGR